MLCKKCGNKVAEGDDFCGECGTKIERELSMVNKPGTDDAGKNGNGTDIPKPPVRSNNSTKVLIGVLTSLIVCLAGVSGWLYYEAHNIDTIGYNDDTGKSDTSDDDKTGEESDSGSDTSDEKDEGELKKPEKPEKPEKPSVDKRNLIDIDEIDRIIAGDTGDADISVCIKDMKNDVLYATDNAGKAMSASALVNIPILYTIAQRLDGNYIRFDTTVTFTYRYSGGRGNIKESQNGRSISIESLTKEMLNYSDNNAANSLIDFCGYEMIESICGNSGYKSVNIQRYLGDTSTSKDNFISAMDVTGMMEKLYKSNSKKIGKSYILKNFKILDSAGNDGIGRAIPASVTFLNHNAVTNSLYNEVGIVDGDDAEYVITVMAANGKRDSSANTAARISEYVYTALNK